MIHSMLMAHEPVDPAAERAPQRSWVSRVVGRLAHARALTAFALLFTLVATVGGCQGPQMAVDTAASLDALATELIDTAKASEQPADGVAAAQAVLDEKRAALAVAMSQLEDMGDAQLEPAVIAEFDKRRFESAARVTALGTELRPPLAAIKKAADLERKKALAKVQKELLTAGITAEEAAAEAEERVPKAVDPVADLDKLIGDYVSLATLEKSHPEWETLHEWASLPQASTFADGVDTVYIFIVILSVFFFVLIMGVMGWFMWRYRRLSEDQKTSSISHNGKIEFLWSAIPAVLLVVIFIWGEVDFLKQTVPPNDAIQVRVTGRQWFWTVEYPDYPGVQLTSSVDESVVTLMVPKGKPVQLTMTSEDVIHSFFVPAFRVKRDVVPGRYTNIWFEATQVGTFNLYCTEYCGDQHSAMIGTVKVLEPDLFEAALAEAGKLDQAEGESSAAFGERIYKRRGCNACHSVDGSPKTGPTWKGLWGKQESTDKGTVQVNDDYIRESVLEPNAQIVTGFNGVKMPSYKGQLEQKHISALIDYIKTLK